MTLSESCSLLSTRKIAAFALITLCLIVGDAQRITAQTGMNCHPMDTREAVAPEKLPPPQKLTGIGNAHIRITATPEAQMWFDQGLNLLHDFWDYESVRAFEQGVRVDPQCVMCYWGIYKATKTNYRMANKYYQDQALTQAISLKGHASKSERLRRLTMKRKTKKRQARLKTKLGLPDLEHAKVAVIVSLRSFESQRSYRHSIDEFVAWYCSAPRLSLNDNEQLLLAAG
jgi:hypothetical protein